VYIGICIHIDSEGNRIAQHQGRVRTFEDLVRIPTVWRKSGYIDQPAVIFPREAFLETGALDPHNHRTMDFELWGKFLMAGLRFSYTQIPVGMFRIHSTQKTHDPIPQTRSLVETTSSLISSTTLLSEESKRSIRAEIDAYYEHRHRSAWQASGRLARTGMPRIVVNSLRRVRHMLPPVHTKRNS
jgi:hypothetical protein